MEEQLCALLEHVKILTGNFVGLQSVPGLVSRKADLELSTWHIVGESPSSPCCEDQDSVLQENMVWAASYFHSRTYTVDIIMALQP